MRATTSTLRSTTYLRILESISQLKCYLGPGTTRNGTENGDKAAWKQRGLLPGTRSGLGFLGFGGLARFSRSRGRGRILHPFFQGTISFAQPFAELWQLLGTENQQGNGKNNDQVPRLEQTFHGEPPEKTLQQPLPLYGTGGVGGSQTTPLQTRPITSVTLPSVLPEG